MNSHIEISVIIAEDHELFREGVINRINREKGMKVIGQAENGKALLALLEFMRPDVILMDIKMPEMDGVRATREIIQQDPTMKVVALTMYDNDDAIISMLEAGASGYLLKDVDSLEMIKIIKEVHEGRKAYCKLINHRIIELLSGNKYKPQNSPLPHELSPVELEIIKLICQSYSTKEIAEILKLSFRTIEGYKSRLLTKMEAKNTTGMVIYAIRHKLVRIEDFD